MGEPWLDSLSEDWNSEPRLSSPPPSLPNSRYGTHTSKTSQSRIPHLAHSIRRDSSGSSFLKPRSSRGIAKSKAAPVLSERSASSLNLPGNTSQRDASKRLASSTASRQASSNFSSSQQSVQRHAVDEPTDETPEWKRRLKNGEDIPSDGFDLFSPSKLEGMFTQPAHAIPHQKEQALTNQQDNGLWTSLKHTPAQPSVAKFQSFRTSRSRGPPMAALLELNEEEDEGGNHKSDHSMSAISSELAQTGLMRGLVQRRVSDLEDPRRPSGSVQAEDMSISGSPGDPRLRTVSGRQEVRNEVISPVTVSTQNTISTKAVRDSIDLDPEMIKKKLMEIGVDYERPSSRSSDRDVSYNGRGLKGEGLPHEDSLQDVTTHSLPEDLSMGTQDFISHGGYINSRRGPASTEASFLKKRLSSVDESSQQEPKSSDFTKFRSSPPPYDLPTGDFVEQSMDDSDLPATPRDESVIHHDQSPERPASAGSPLKLFGNRDTYTNNKLLRILSQYEQDKNDQSQSADSFLDEPHQQSPREGDFRMSQFGQGELDTYNFEKEVARPIIEDTPFSVDGDKIFQSFADLTIDDEGTVPNVRPYKKDIVDQDIEETDAKRMPSSPAKERTPKRRRTLIRNETGRQDVDGEIVSGSKREPVHEQLSLAGTKRKDARPGEDGMPAGPDVLASRSILRPKPGSRKSSAHSQHRSTSQDSTIRRADQPKELAEALAAELASFAQGVSQAHHDSRKPSLATKDYMEEANKVMEFIRARGKPKQRLPEISEPMDTTELDADKILDLEIDDDSTAEPFSRPPSREGPVKPRENPRIAKHDSQTAHHLQKFKESDEIELLPSTSIANSVNLTKRETEQDPSPVLVEEEESQPSNIRIIDRIESPRQRDQLASATHDHANAVLSSDGSTRRTFATESSNASGQKGMISCGQVSIPDNVGTMTFNHEKQIWVKQQLTKLKQQRVQSSHKQVSQTKEDEHTLEDDPFANIPDLSIDEAREAAMKVVAKPPSRPSTADTVLVAPLSPREEGDHDEANVGNLNESKDKARQGTQPSLTEDLEQPVPNQAATNGNDRSGTQRLPFRSTEISKHEERLHQGVPSRAPYNQSTLNKQPRVVTIAFSSPVASEFPRLATEGSTPVSDDEDFLPPEDSDDDTEYLKTPRATPHQTGSKTVPRQRLGSDGREGLHHRFDTVSRRPVSRIDERDEDVGQNENKSLVHIEDPQALTPAPVGPVEISKPVAPYKNTSILCLTPLSEFTMHQADRAKHPEESFVQERAHPKALLQAHGAMSLSVDTLVKAITDAVEDDPFWEQLQRLNLKDSRLQSVHGLQEYCPMLERLDISQNQLTQLDGLPSTLRQLDVSHNKVNDFTSWSCLPNLQYVDVSNNQLETLEGFGSLVHMRKLKCVGNTIRDIEGVIDLDGLISLDLQHNLLDELDFDGVDLPRLEELDLSHNRLTAVRNLHHLPQLRELNLSGNSLRELQVNQPLNRLKTLTLSDNDLEHLDLAMFPALTALVLDNNAVKNIEGLPGAQKLRMLSLCNQRNSMAIVDLVLSTPNECSEICLSSNVLSQGQLSLPKLPNYNLKKLDLAACGLKSLPVGFGDYFPNCRILNLNFNAISELSPLIGSIKLQKLFMAGNRIKRLRRTCLALARLLGLEELDVRDNPLTVGFHSPDCGNEKRNETFSLPQRSAARDLRWLELMDENTALKRKMMELLLAEGCPKLQSLDGLSFDRNQVSKRDTTWEHLTSMGVLMKTIEAPPLSVETQQVVRMLGEEVSRERRSSLSASKRDSNVHEQAQERSVMVE